MLTRDTLTYIGVVLLLITEMIGERTYAVLLNPYYHLQKNRSRVLDSEEDGWSIHETSLLSFSAFRRHRK